MTAGGASRADNVQDQGPEVECANVPGLLKGRQGGQSADGEWDGNHQRSDGRNDSSAEPGRLQGQLRLLLGGRGEPLEGSEEKGAWPRCRPVRKFMQ